MSAGVRQALSDAASSVSGVTCSPYFRQTTKAGEGFVRVESITADETGFGYMVAWQVCVLLPQDLAQAEKRLDILAGSLCEALSPEGLVSTAQPVQLALDAGTVPALVVTIIRAQE